jgi:hypothetical protein
MGAETGYLDIEDKFMAGSLKIPIRIDNEKQWPK